MLNHIAALARVLENKPPRKVRTPDKDRETRKHYWDDLYRQKTDDEFKDKMRISPATCNLRYYFEYLMGLTYPPTDKFEAVSDITGQLALSLYHLAHGVSYSVLEDVCSIVWLILTTFILRTRDGVTWDGRWGWGC